MGILNIMPGEWDASGANSSRFQYGLLGLAGLGNLFANSGPRYSTNIAEATMPRENPFMAQLPGQMALIARQEQERRRAALMEQMYGQQLRKGQREEANANAIDTAVGRYFQNTKPQTTMTNGAGLPTLPDAPGAVSTPIPGTGPTGAGMLQDPAVRAALYRSNPIGMAQLEHKDTAPIAVGADQTLVDRNTYQPVFRGPGKAQEPTADMKEHAHALQTGAYKGNFAQWMKDKYEGMGTRVTVNNAGENEFSKQLASKSANYIADSKASADKAQAANFSIQEGRQLLDQGIFTGPTSERQAKLGSFFAKLGITDGDTSARTQTYAAIIAGNVGNAIKQFGSGTGLSDADREYAKQLAGGSIEVDERALRRILDINERLNNFEINRHNKNIDAISKDPNIPDYVKQMMRSGAISSGGGQAAAPAGNVPDAPKGANGKIDASKLKKGQPYRLPDGRVGRWTGLDFEAE